MTYPHGSELENAGFKQEIRLNPLEEPLTFSFVKHICQLGNCGGTRVALVLGNSLNGMSLFPPKTCWKEVELPAYSTRRKKSVICSSVVVSCGVRIQAATPSSLARR